MRLRRSLKMARPTPWVPRCVALLALRVVMAAVSLTAVSGCEWFSTMSDTVSIQAHEREPVPPPEHAVPLDGLPEFDLTTVEGVLTPPPPGERSLAVGKAYYETFCAVCHGDEGFGNGPISTRFPAIPAIVTPKVAAYSDAYLFALIAQGRGLMPEYSRIPQAARWDIVRHIRALGAGPPGVPATSPADTAGRESP
jgi:mono/diheme cytochrome c family protein